MRFIRLAQDSFPDSLSHSFSLLSLSICQTANAHEQTIRASLVGRMCVCVREKMAIIVRGQMIGGLHVQVCVHACMCVNNVPSCP